MTVNETDLHSVSAPLSRGSH